MLDLESVPHLKKEYLERRPKTSSLLCDDGLFGQKHPYGHLKRAYFIDVLKGSFRSESYGL